MSRNGSGTYNLPVGNPVVTGTTITSNWGNTTMSDIATALTGSVAADGQTPITGNLQMGGNLVTGLGSPSASTDSATKGYVDVALAALITVPSGSIFMWPSAASPTGWLICDGSAVSRTTYAALFAIVSTTFGVGDGTTTFNLPNLVDKFAIGKSGTKALGATGGSADAVVVSHTHTATVTDPGHAHTVPFGSTSTPNTYIGSANNIGNNESTNSATTGISVANSTTGVSGTNANLPPYLSLNFIIKV